MAVAGAARGDIECIAEKDRGYFQLHKRPQKRKAGLTKGRRAMANKSRNKLNQPPSGEGKKQSPRLGAANKLRKRADVLQAAGWRQNIGTAEEEEAARSEPKRNPKRPKAGR